MRFLPSPPKNNNDVGADLFEVYFWIEKVLLIGLVGLFPKAGVDQWLVGLVINVIYIIVLTDR
jgi:hypothetical protein